MEIVIRPYLESDFGQVTEVWYQSWESTGVSSPNPALRADARQRLPRSISGGWRVHVAVADAEIVGFVALKDHELGQLFVAPQLQGRGIGKQLLDFVKLQLPAGFWLTTPAAGRARHFYEREGLIPEVSSVHPEYGHLEIRYEWRP